MLSAITNLLADLIKWNTAYRTGNAIVPDATYDAGEARLKQLLMDIAATDPASSTNPTVVAARQFLSGIGLTPADDSPFAKVTHVMQMTSLNKATNLDEFQEWFAGVNSPQTGITYIVSEKLDGISVNCSYDAGNLVLAATRGDGDTGEDITRNVRKMQGVLSYIKGFSGQLRGEIILTHADWKSHFPEYTNPRNAASGIAKRLDGAGSEHLTVQFYQMVRSGLDSAGNPVTQIPRKELEFQVLEKLGAQVAGWTLCSTYAEIRAVYQEYIDGKRASLGKEIDGLVVEISSAVLADNLGLLNKRPKSAVAIKFPAQELETVLREIEWQIGKSGRITPVAIFDEVDFNGAKTKRASLSGVRQVANLKLYAGCRIRVARRNDVIPRVDANIDLGIENDS